jgi:hypothetical protein
MQTRGVGFHAIEAPLPNRLDAASARYFFTYFCTRQFSVSVTKISPRALTAR